MKKLILLLAFTINATAQICNKEYIADNQINKTFITTLDTCASPDGNTQIIASPPPSYAWLDANGYCYTITPTKNLAVCYTFTSIATTVTLNAGYSSTGCAAISFSGFNLYTCAPACAFIGTGLTFSGLNIGQCYTWCFSGTCTGPGPGFTSVCPYYMQPVPLPVEISYYNVNQEYKQNVIEWKTATEHNSSHFEVERATDNDNFSSIGTVTASFNSNTIKKYQLIDKQPKNGLNYYRLRQFDSNGSNTTYPVIIVVNNKQGELKPYKIFNIAGIEVSEDYEGIKIIQYLDGKMIKTY